MRHAEEKVFYLSATVGMEPIECREKACAVNFIPPVPAYNYSSGFLLLLLINPGVPQWPVTASGRAVGKTNSRGHAVHFLFPRSAVSPSSTGPHLLSPSLPHHILPMHTSPGQTSCSLPKHRANDRRKNESCRAKRGGRRRTKEGKQLESETAWVGPGGERAPSNKRDADSV
ncbi:hypothetical protein DPEC_G00267630 [Dallia pectoralis]|uniref:Uncharacterized protein n=1 Tax=Dallia pectoralis TaxID=75939 RepID=A0ACC2FNU6_DALPE|nr:hypothetical protein DPEC_G00267630 [Dallia pectoralis]